MSDEDVEFLEVLLAAGEKMAAQKFVIHCFVTARGDG